jgi:hypothetical protein
LREFTLIVVYFVSTYFWSLAIAGMFTDEGTALGMLIAMALGFATVYGASKLLPAKDGS